MSGSQSPSWNDVHFCGLRSQTNVYSLSKTVSNDKIKLLAASIDGHLASMKFELQSSSSDPIIVPVSNDDVLFNSGLGSNNVPDSEGETEIASIDVIGDWDHQGNSILVVTYLKRGVYDEDKAPESFMNLYQLLDGSDDDSTLEASRSLIQNLSLDFTPFKLTHHKTCLEEKQVENFLLLSGSDHKVHTYQPTEGYIGFQEVQTSKYFPELINIDDCVTQIEIKQLDDIYRLTSYGTQNGLVCLFLVNEDTKEILSSWTSELDSPITSIHLFHQHTSIPCPDFIKPSDNVSQSNNEEEGAWNLLVTSAVDPATVYHDVVCNGLSKCRLLPVSNSQDVVLCSCVMDVDFDGENEILIGTYGKVLLVYKLIYEKPQVYSSTPFHSPMPVPIHSDTPILSSDITDHKPSNAVGRRDSSECQEKDVRRRHKSVATTISADGENASLLDKHDKHKSEDFYLPDGTSQQALMLRLVRSQENLTSLSPRSIQFDTPDRLMTPDLTVPTFAAMTPGIDYPCYKLLWTRRFCNPVMGLSCDDVTGDGMQDLVALTLKGLHVLQPDPQEVSTIILNRLQMLCNTENEAASQSGAIEDKDSV